MSIPTCAQHQRQISFAISTISAVLLFLCITSDVKAGLIVKAPPYIGLNEGLVGFWSFNGPDMSQSTNNVWALDRSGQGNNGVLKNMATSTARKIGKLGQALEFDGVNDYVDVGSDTTLDNISIMTISAWINPRSAGEGTSGTIVGKILGGTQGFQFYVCSNHNGECPSTTNTITFFKPDGFNNIAWDVDTANTIKMNTWQHVVLIYDNSSFSNDPIFYVNGIKLTATILSPRPQQNIDDNNADLAIGNVSDSTQTFDGQIDEVRIYNRALTPDEIKRLYKIGSTFVVNKTRQDTLREGLVGHWSFDGPDMSQSTNNVWALDRSGNNNNGVLKNMATSSVRKIGKLGQALDFDGVDDRVDLGNTASLTNLRPPYTYTAWIRPDVVNNADMDIWGKSIAGNGPEFYLSNAGLISFFTSLSITDFHHRSSTVLTANTWYFVAFSTTDAGTNSSFYINGAATGVTVVSNGSGTFPNDSSYNAAIGHPGSVIVNQQWFDGQIDEVRVYNHALSPDEIKRLYKIGSTFVVNKTRQDTLREGLVGHWSFDGPDMSQSTNNVWALDRSGNNNNGVLKNMATSSVRKIGKLGQALDFDGVDDVVSLGTPSSLDINANEKKITISAWIYPRSIGENSEGDIFSSGNSSEAFALKTCDNIGDCSTIANTFIFRMQDTNADANAWAPSANTIKFNQWQHVAATFVCGDVNAVLYYNGQIINVTKTATGLANCSNSALTDKYIGNRNAIDNTFNGLIDEVRVYNRALTPDEIKRLYNMGR